MSNLTTKTVTVGMSLILGLALAVPVAAAGPGARATGQARRAERQLQRTLRAEAKTHLTKRIENKLRARKARFDAASANINRRITRLSELADKIEALGGDVSAAREKLELARTELATALDLEAQAAAKFQAIVDSDDTKAAFRDARDAGRAAVAKLKAARVALRDCVHLLQAELQTLEVADDADTAPEAQ